MKRQLKREERELKRNEKRLEKLKREGNWEEEIKYDSEVKCVLYFENFILRKEKWTKNGGMHRDGDLPAIISYHENGNKQEEEWYKNGEMHREDNLPAWIKYYYEQKDCKQMENWYYNEMNRRENDLPVLIFYNMNGKIRSEVWLSNDKNRSDNHLPWMIDYYETGIISSLTWLIPKYVECSPTMITYYENGGIKSECWSSIEGICFEIFYDISGLKLKKCRYEDRKLFKRTRYDDIGLKADETWYDENGTVHREGDLPAYISYFYKVSKTELIGETTWYKHGKVHRECDLPAKITFNENGSIKTEKWFQNNICIKIVFHDDLAYTNDFVATGDDFSLCF